MVIPGVSRINLKGQYVTHRVFGRGQIVEHDADSVTVLFKKSETHKKFIYPSAIQTFLVLEDAETANRFKEFTDELASNNTALQAAAAVKMASEKRVLQELAKAAKKSAKKPARTAKK